MKKQFAFIALTLLLTAAVTVSAQEATPWQEGQSITTPPRWVSDKGYWVVESNIYKPAVAYVYFYTNDDVLIHKQTLNGQHLNFNKTRTKMRLKKALESIMIARQAGKSMDNQQEWVASLLHR